MLLREKVIVELALLENYAPQAECMFSAVHHSHDDANNAKCEILSVAKIRQCFRGKQWPAQNSVYYIRVTSCHAKLDIFFHRTCDSPLYATVSMKTHVSTSSLEICLSQSNAK